MPRVGLVWLRCGRGKRRATGPPHGRGVVPDCPGRHDFFFKTLGRHETGGKAEVPDAGTRDGGGTRTVWLGDGCLPTRT